MVTRLRALFLAVLMVVSAQAFAHKEDKDVRGLSNVTVLIVRHAEKPDEGPLLSPKGEQRAAAYASYFDPLLLNGISVVPQRLIATSDSKESSRPRLTLTPLSQRLQLALETPYSDDQVGKLVKSLRKSNQAPTVLIAWHHGHIDKLIEAFGGDGQALTGMKKWPENVYDWLIVLRFDEQGQLVESRSQKVQEHLLPGDIAAANAS